MKEIKTWSLAFTYVGCFLGAGFISGQELWQFFGSFGNLGYVGFLLAVVLFSAIGILFVRLTQMTQCSDMDRLLVPWNVKWLRAASGAVGAVFLFFVVVSMSAGVGAMLAQLFDVSAWLGSAVFMALVFAVALLGVTGMVNAFSALIPVLITATVAFAVGAYATFGTEGVFQLRNVNNNPLMPNWFIAALTFVSYNILGGIGIMSPVGQYVRRKRHIYGGIILAHGGAGQPSQRDAGHSVRPDAAAGHVLQRAGQSGGTHRLSGAEGPLRAGKKEAGVGGAVRTGVVCQSAGLW